MKDTLDERILQKQGKQKRCKVCGELLEDDARFCEYCGAKVEEDGEEEARRREEARKQEELKKQAEMKREAGLKLLFGIGVVLLISILLMYAFGSDRRNKKSDQEAQTTLLRENETTYMDAEKEGFADGTESVKEETETEIAEADIDAVHNRNCRISGLLFYTDSMDAPVLVLDDMVSLYVNSTDGEQVYYGAVSQICFGTCAIGKKKLKKYNNVKVDVTGSLWAEDDVVYVDVQELSGELPETEKETETEYGKDRDYILPESDSKYLTEADIAGLTLQEINYAKNEIYARHGRKFDSAELRRYFKSKEWYDPRIDPDDFSVKVFNSYEKKNTEFLAAKEESMQRGGYKLDQ